MSGAATEPQIQKPVLPAVPHVAPTAVPEVPSLDEATFPPPAGNAREAGAVRADECKPRPAPALSGAVIGCGGF